MAGRSRGGGRETRASVGATVTITAAVAPNAAVFSSVGPCGDYRNHSLITCRHGCGALSRRRCSESPDKNRKSGVEFVRAEISACTAEAPRSRVVDERDAAPDEGGEGKRVDGAGGGVYIIGWRTEPGRKRRRCLKRARVQEKGPGCQQQEQDARHARMTLLIACC